MIMLVLPAKKFINAFPLMSVTARWEGYFVDRAGTVYSNKKTTVPSQVHVMKGTRRYGTSHRNYTLNGTSVQGPFLLSQAKKVGSWAKETAPYVDTIAPVELPAEAKPQWPFPTDKAQSDAYLGKNQDVLQAVKDRGFVIASITEGKLTFSSEPKIHSTVKSVDEELARLAKLMPGTVFVKLHIISAAVAGGLTFI